MLLQLQLFKHKNNKGECKYENFSIKFWKLIFKISSNRYGKQWNYCKGYFERIGQPNSFLSHKVHGRKHKFEIEAKDHEEAIAFVLNRLTNDHYGVIKSLEELEAIGHRIVHGGEKFSDAVLITDEVIEEIKNVVI